MNGYKTINGGSRLTQFVRQKVRNEEGKKTETNIMPCSFIKIVKIYIYVRVLYLLPVIFMIMFINIISEIIYTFVSIMRI